MTVWLRTAILAIVLACTPGHIVTSTAAAPRIPASVDLHTVPAGVAANPLQNHAREAVKLPVAFEKNDGQFAESLAFSVRTPNGRVGITRGGAVTLSAPRVAGSAEHHFTPFHLHGASSADAVGLDQLPTHVRYVHGSNPALWRQDAHLYHRLQLRNVYPAIDWEWGLDGEAVEYQFVVRAGGDPGRIALAFDRADRLHLVNGNLVVERGSDAVEHRRPRAYQDIDGMRRDVPVSWRIEGHRGRFTLGAYDRALPLIIDPVLAWSAYVGGSGAEEGSDVATDTDGSIFVSGATTDTEDAFIAKLNPSGALAYITYFGGTATEFAPRIAVQAGRVYFAGATYSNDFPVLAAFQTRSGGGSDGYAGSLRSDGGLVFSTYVGGSAIDALQAIVAANDGTLWISGVTFSANWPIASPLQSSFAGQSDGVLVHLSSSGQLLMSSFVGDGNCQGAHALALAPDGAIYMGGSFAFVQVVFGREECVSTSIGWLVKVAPGGGSIAWERLVDGTDDVGGLVAPGADSIWAVGRTTSTGMPTGPDAYDATCGMDGACDGTSDGFLSIRDSDGFQTYGTYLGGAGQDEANAIALDDADQVWVAGSTNSSDWPTSRTSDFDAFVLRLSATSHVINYTKLIGGEANDTAWGVAANSQGAYVAGSTRSEVLPGQLGSRRGFSDAFVTQIASLARTVFIDHPAAGSSVLPDVAIDGWALDDRSLTGTGIDTIHMWAFPMDQPTTPVFLGVAQYGLARPDVGAAFGSRFSPSGYRLTASLPRFGRYLIGVYGRSTTTGTFEAVRTVTVDVADTARTTIDMPAPGATVSSPLVISGWALNTASTANTGIDGVDVWAFPAGGGPGVFVGAAFYGEDRGDVAAAFGPQFRFSGFHVTTSHLWAGSYTLAAYPHFAGTARYGAPAVHGIHLSPGPMVLVDQPVGSTTIDRPFTISGWALDRGAPAGTGIDQVLVYANRLDSSGGTGTVAFLGVAEYARARPDVSNALGGQFVNCGFRLPVSGLSPGFYRFGIYAHSPRAAAGTFPYFETWTGIIEVR
jgi:hypothetical protein